MFEILGASGDSHHPEWLQVDFTDTTQRHSRVAELLPAAVVVAASWLCSFLVSF